jgi:hypothetical protein
VAKSRREQPTRCHRLDPEFAPEADACDMDPAKRSRALWSLTLAAERLPAWQKKAAKTTGRGGNR